MYGWNRLKNDTALAVHTGSLLNIEKAFNFLFDWSIFLIKSMVNMERMNHDYKFSRIFWITANNLRTTELNCQKSE